jgi:electron transfer flavoprotein alpha subunit
MILVIAEQRDGVLNRASWEPIAAAQQAGGGAGLPVKVLVLGSGAHAGAAAKELAAAKVDEVLAAGHDLLAAYTADGFTKVIADVVNAEQPARVWLSHTYQTRDFAPKLAARLDRAIITDCTGTKPYSGGDGDGAGSLAFVRPMFQAKLAADVVPQGPAPHLATFQIGSYRADQVTRGGSGAAAPVREVSVTLAATDIRQKPEAPFKEAKQAVDLTQAERIVSVGRGIKGEEHIALAKQLAEALGAEIAASRPICDAGWLRMDRQIGSSGQTVAPKLYLALGISGAIQHVVGMKGARTIVAINKDPEAPIFEIADYGIAGDLFEIVPAMIKELKG